MDPLDFLDGQPAADAPAAPAPEAQPAPEPAPSEGTPTAGPVRGPDGKFVSAQPAAPAAAAQPAAATQAPQPTAQPVLDPGQSPYFAAMLDERDKRQVAERRLADLQRQQQAQPAPQAPDRFEDPEGHDRFMQERTDERLFEMRVDMSERFAVNQYGEDTVKTAVEWGFQRCAQDPHFNAQVRAAPDPIGFVVQQHRRDEVFAKVGDQFDPAKYEAFLAWQAQQTAAPALQAQPQSQQPAAQTAQPAPATPAVKPPPRSLVHAPQAGGAAAGAVSPEDAFAAAIPR